MITPDEFDSRFMYRHEFWGAYAAAVEAEDAVRAKYWYERYTGQNTRRGLRIATHGTRVAPRHTIPHQNVRANLSRRERYALVKAMAQAEMARLEAEEKS